MATQVTQSQPTNTGRRTIKSRNRNQKKANVASTHGSAQSSENTPAGDDAENTIVATATVEGEEESDVCWICAEPVKFYSLSECNHRTCHVCALRLRALYKKLDCTFCKHPQTIVIFTTSSSAQFDEYKLDDMDFKDAKLSIVFETQAMMEETLILLRFNCPDQQCAFIAKGWNDLKMHVRAMHGKVMCDLCIRFKKVFAHEHALYTQSQLNLHLPLPQRSNKSVSKDNDKVENGVHPLCEFCRECLFGDDELFAHMRERHEECFVCKRQGVRDQYFLDYNSLERHFTDVHHPCNHPTCLAQKFVVFGSLMDLKAHMVEEHGANMSARDMKDARRLEAHFEFDEQRSNSGRRRERDRDREHDREPPPAPIPPSRPLDRRREGFGAALTTENVPVSGTSTPAPNQRSGRSSPSPSSDLDPETARRHAAFMARVSSLTSNSSAAAASIRSAIRSFRASESAARDLITTFYNIVDRDLELTASLIVPLVDLFDDEDKRRQLLQSFNGFKVEQRQQFPDLVPGGPDTPYAGVASGRVLNAKHSTQSRRSTGQVLDRVARAATSSTSVPVIAGPSTRPPERFPALPRIPPSVSVPVAAPAPAFRQPQRSTPWASSSAAAAASIPNPGPRIHSEQKINRPSSSKPMSGLSGAAFPSLPSAAPRAKPPMSGNKSLRNIIGNQKPAVNPWSSGNEGNGETSETTGESEETAGHAPIQPKKGKKKGKEKVTLFTLGAFPT